MVLKVCWHLRLKIYILLAYFLLYVYVTASARSKDPLDMELHPLKYYSVCQPRDKTGNVLTSELIISTLKPRLGKFSMVFSSVFSILFLAFSVSVRKERYCLEMLKETVFIDHFEAQGKLGDVFSLKTTTWCHSRQQRPRPTLIN